MNFGMSYKEFQATIVKGSNEGMLRLLYRRFDVGGPPLLFVFIGKGSIETALESGMALEGNVVREGRAVIGTKVIQYFIVAWKSMLQIVGSLY